MRADKSEMDLATETMSPELIAVAGFREHDMVQFRCEVTSHGRRWPAGTTGAIVSLGSDEQGCTVEVEESLDGLVDAAYADLEPWTGCA